MNRLRRVLLILILSFTTSAIFAQNDIKITKIIPQSAASGSNISIYGTEFIKDSTTVFFDDEAATIIENFGTKIVVEVPDTSPGFHYIKISVSGESYTYLQPFSVLQRARGGISFSDLRIVDTHAYGATSVAVADIDNDFDYDVVSSLRTSDRINWSRNNKYGFFEPPRGITDKVLGANRAQVGDINGDQKIDILSGSEVDGGLAWYQNLGSGKFGGQKLIDKSVARDDIETGDLNGDGRIDIVVATASHGEGSPLTVYSNKSGGFEKQTVVEYYTRPIDIYLDDIDNDGDLDILYASFGDDRVGEESNHIGWIENLGDNNYSESHIIATTEPRGVNAIHSADLDNDGDVDILVSSSLDHAISWYENLGDGEFGPRIFIKKNEREPLSVYAADLDGDGDQDVISTSGYYEKVAWYENLGDGNFGSQKFIQGNTDARMVTTADLDNDGDLDIIVPYFQSGNIYWYKNTTEINVSNELAESIPENFELNQNYPNPFNPSTTINFSIPVNANVILSIYNILGKELVTLIDDRKPAGSHSVKFDGSSLSSGIYFYTLQAGDFIQTKKLTLIK